MYELLFINRNYNVLLIMYLFSHIILVEETSNSLAERFLN